ncbi:MAG TPA: hypothetical protein VLA91_09775 [Acidimicrobiia bacterium]|nr:hypothetical protein [Acidimicrobiia bacterium]
MIVELIGPGGVGKTTVEPLVAARMGIPHFPGLKRHGFEGEPLGAAGVWWGRIASVARSPLLFYASWRAHRGRPKERLRFAFDICRRERIARRAAAIGSGVVASGSVHALCAASANTETDLTGLVARISLADVYVRLTGDPEELTARLAGRQGITAGELEGHAELQESYLAYADSILGRIDRPIVAVVAKGPPDRVADDIVSSMGQ